MDEAIKAKLKALSERPPAPISNLPPIKAHGNGNKQAHNDGIQQMADRKDNSIKRACSLNAAMVMVKAYQEAMVAVDAFKGLDRPQIEGLLKSLKKAEFSDNMQALEAKEEVDEEIPF